MSWSTASRDTREMVLTPAPESAAQARRFVAGALDALGARASRDIGVLLTSELVTNALLYAQSRVTVRVGSAEADLPVGCVRVEVSDESSHPVRERNAGPDATSGRGLSIVDKLADRWGVEEVPGDGKVVWFEVPRG